MGQMDTGVAHGAADHCAGPHHVLARLCSLKYEQSSVTCGQRGICEKTRWPLVRAKGTKQGASKGATASSRTFAGENVMSSPQFLTLHSLKESMAASASPVKQRASKTTKTRRNRQGGWGWEGGWGGGTHRNPSDP